MRCFPPYLLVWAAPVAEGRGRLAVVAVGGNALVSDEDHLSIGDQYHNVQALAPALADVLAAGWDLVLTHGNGPQVGFILHRSELASHQVAPVPLDYAVGDTQGAMGYMFVKALDNELSRRGQRRPVVALVTRTVVDGADPAFAHPDKPVGAFLSEAAARASAQRWGWEVMTEAGRGWRRVVPSPTPLEVVEAPVVRLLVDQGVVVIAAGGGGVAVVRDEQGCYVGVEAVVDKDRTSALLAQTLGADALVICTGVERVALDFGLPTQRWLDRISCTEAAEYLGQGQFAAGSMGPKIEALLSFVGGGPARLGVVTTPDRMAQALTGGAGTAIVEDPVT